tara:strand:+ start:129 stop:797 length:669 start_codon:yes stop_codon:yes gene_type:complete
VLKITLEIMDKQKDIQNMLDRALINRMNKIVPKIASESREAIVKVVEETIKNTKEVQSLKKADIRGELGLKAAWVSRAINDIAASVSQTTSFRYKQFKKTGSKINGGITIEVQPADLKNVISLASGQLTYMSSTYKTSVTLDWLEWLLKKGDAIIVGKFDFNLQPGTGRSGQGTMKRNVGGWRVPPSVAGTIDDNFITRAFDKQVQARINSVIEESTRKLWG